MLLQNERKFNSRLFDLKDRLEQCHSTNRSMQNYVQFLKNSYANVFGETAPYGPTPMKPTGIP
jgi:outer dense fiber protein 2